DLHLRLVLFQPFFRDGLDLHLVLESENVISAGSNLLNGKRSVRIKSGELGPGIHSVSGHHINDTLWSAKPALGSRRGRVRLRRIEGAFKFRSIIAHGNFHGWN